MIEELEEELEQICIVNWFRDQPEDCARHKMSGICITHHSDWCPFCVAGSDDENGFFDPYHAHDLDTLNRILNHAEFSFR